MSGRNGHLFTAARLGVVALIAVAGVWIVGALAPFDNPAVPERQGPVGVYTDYKPHSGKCSQERLDALPTGTPREDQRKECAREAYYYALQQETLTQAGRATNAAEESLRMSFLATRIAFVQAILSTLAAVFTGWAAWEAGRAAVAAQSSVEDARAEAAEQSDRFSKQLTLATQSTDAATEASAATKRLAEAASVSAEAANAALEHARAEARAQSARLDQQLGLADQTMQYTAESAYAMKDVARAMASNVRMVRESVDLSRDRSAQQMRAYVSVLIGGGQYQERERGMRFAASTKLINTGHTPAHRVSFRAAAAVLPIPIPPDFRFPLPKQTTGGSMMPPGQEFTITAAVSDYVPDDTVEQVKRAESMALVSWGAVSYRDVFGKRRKVTFCHILEFPKDGTVRGVYDRRHNRAN